MFVLNRYNYIFIVILSFLISRIISNYYFNISLDEKWINGLWQHIDINILKEKFLSSILLFHAQPPLWNIILGLGSKLDYVVSIGFYLSFFNFILTIVILYCSHQILKNLVIKKFQSLTILFLLVICSPSILFYEKFASYAHFTCALLFLIKLNFLKIFKKYKIKYEIYIYLFSTFTILTWSAYVIYFNLLIFFLLMPLTIKLKRYFKSFFIFIIFFILGSLPSLKNKILFDIYSNSSWTGLNASQAVGYDRKDWPLCSFNNDNIKKYNKEYKVSLKNKKNLDDKFLNDGSFNDLGYIYKSKNCGMRAKNYLFLNFREITEEKIKRFISVHAHLSFDFAFKPKNWKENFIFFEKLIQNNIFKIIVFIFFTINYVFYITITSLSFVKKKRNYKDYFLIINFFLYLYLLLVSFYGSTWEQERMRYTGYSFILISSSIFINKVFNKLRDEKFLNW